MPLPIYIVAPPGARTATLAAEDLADSVRRIESVEALGALDALEPGCILVDRDSVSEADLLTVADRVAGAEAGWTLAVIEGDGEPIVRTLGFGSASSTAEVASFSLAPDENAGVLMELRSVLSEVARVRHDLNNPLTSALAEVQLLLFDAMDEEVRESLEVIQSQLRRMRDLIAATSHLRPPRV